MLSTALECVWSNDLPRLVVDSGGWRVCERLANLEVQSDAKLGGCQTIEAKLPVHFVRLPV